MHTRFRRLDPLVWLTCAGFALRLAFVIFEPASRLAGDEFTWTGWAVGVQEGLTSRHVRFSPFRWELIFYPPLYPYFIGSLSALGGSLVAVKLAQAAVGALLVLAVGRIGMTFLGRRPGLVAAVIVAAYPDLVWYTSHFWSETLFLTLMWWGFERLAASDNASAEAAQQSPTTRWPLPRLALGGLILAGGVRLVWGHDLEPWAGVLFLTVLLAGLVTLERLGAGENAARRAAVAAGVLVGLAALTRETVLYFAPLAAVWLAWRRREGGRRAILFLTPLVLVVAPWTYRNYVVAHAFVPVATSGALNLWQGNTRLSRAEVYRLSETVRGPGHVRVAQQRFHQRLAVEAILDRQPWWLAEKLVSEMPPFWEADSLALIHLMEKHAYGPYRARTAVALAVVMIAPYLVLLVLGVAGVMRVPVGRAVVLLVLFLVFHNGLHVVAHGFARYRLPIMPIVILMAAAGAFGRPLPAGSTWRRRTLAYTLAITLTLAVIPSLMRHWSDPAFGGWSLDSSQPQRLDAVPDLPNDPG